jgi:hypothetical protein
MAKENVAILRRALPDSAPADLEALRGYESKAEALEAAGSSE